eukprot:805935-Rhodomonas_salina.1
MYRKRVLAERRESWRKLSNNVKKRERLLRRKLLSHTLITLCTVCLECAFNPANAAIFSFVHSPARLARSKKELAS